MFLKLLISRNVPQDPGSHFLAGLAGSYYFKTRLHFTLNSSFRKLPSFEAMTYKKLYPFHIMLDKFPKISQKE